MIQYTYYTIHTILCHTMLRYDMIQYTHTMIWYTIMCPGHAAPLCTPALGRYIYIYIYREREIYIYIYVYIYIYIERERERLYTYIYRTACGFPRLSGVAAALLLHMSYIMIIVCYIIV